MTGYGSSFSKLAALLVSGLLLGLWAGPAAAQVVADDVVCAGCVQASDIANGTIGPNKLIPGSINATTIANGVIGPNKLIPGSINTATIANDAIRSNKILDGAVQSADIANGAVGTDEIATDGVGADEIAAGAVTTSEVADDSLFDVDLANEAGADFDDTAASAIFLTSAPTIYETVTLTVPMAGLVIVNASGWYNFQAGSQLARCSITTGTFLDGESLAIAENDNLISWLPWALTRAYEVSAGSFTVNLVCDLFTGSSTRLGATNLNALYVPTRY